MMMTKLGSKSAMLVAAALVACVAPAFAGDGFIGEWTTVTTIEGTDFSSDMKVWEEDGEVKVSVSDDLNGDMETSDAAIDGDTLTFGILVEALSPDPLQVTMTLEEGEISGSLESDLDEFPMSATSVGGGDAGLAGMWDVIANVAGEDYPVVMTVEQSGSDLLIAMEDDLNGEMGVDDIELDGNVLAFNITIDALSPDPLPVEVTFDGDSFEGVLDGGDMGEIPLSGTKAGSGVDEEIMAVLENFKAGMEDQDTDKIGLALSDDFDHYEFGDKDTMISFLSDTFSGGDLDDTEIDLSGIEIEIDGDDATAYPGELMASFGTLTIEFSFSKEDDGAWRVTTIEVEGL
jgi:hypothetical protein